MLSSLQSELSIDSLLTLTVNSPVLCTPKTFFIFIGLGGLFQRLLNLKYHLLRCFYLYSIGKKYLHLMYVACMIFIIPYIQYCDIHIMHSLFNYFLRMPCKKNKCRSYSGSRYIQTPIFS